MYRRPCLIVEYAYGMDYIDLAGNILQATNRYQLEMARLIVYGR